ncbi:MAG: adenosylmethionine decarboxylase [Rhodospirillaceae bacterium]|nr:adenosylmethionine decarboxylase [Rhodospirillaceae bacterium]
MRKAARLGGFSKERLTPTRETNTNVTYLATAAQRSVEVSQDHYIRKDGVEYAGTHLLVELWGASNLADVAGIEQALLDGARKAGATILHSYMHPFGEGMGVSGVVVLAESHISIHTWPERGYAAIDLFMCGNADPYKAIPVLKAAFTPASVQVAESKRGLVV